jgi:DNA gyrase subunit B
MAETKYDQTNIQVLKGLDPVRTRPAMFIGDTGKKGLHHLVWEILDNSVDEAMAGYCDQINVVVEADGETISLEDNGRGIPVEVHKGEGKSALEVVLTVLHAGGKFDGSGYEAAGGLHGVGASCVNALSDYLHATVWRDGGQYEQEYVRGVPKKKVEKTKDLGSRDKKHGTRITWHPDNQIFKDSLKLDETVLLKRFREVAFLNKGLSIHFENKATGTKEIVVASGGIADYVKYLTELRTQHYPSEPLFVETKTKLETRAGTVMVQVAMNYTAEDDETILSFANNINTVDGGTHTSGFKTALTRVVNQFARQLGMLKDKDANLSGDDVREGLTAIISVRLPQPEFVGQTKAKLGTVEIEGIVSTTVTEMLTKYFDANAATIKKIVERAKIAQEARDAAKKQSALIKRKSFLGNNTRLPGKLSDCNSNKREICELFIVEGNSAAGSAKDGRDPETQAILPIRGKIINAEKNDTNQLLKNTEIVSLILALGTGFKDEFDIEKRRYDKIVIMADADDDGCHIATLLITFFYRFMRQLVIDGHVYLAQPPLFRVDGGGTRTYCFDEKEMQAAVKQTGEKSKVVRFKGLGEMDAEELADTTMKRGNRRLIQLQVDDLGDSERMISVLMGSNVQARKDHIAGQVNSSGSSLINTGISQNSPTVELAASKVTG